MGIGMFVLSSKLKPTEHGLERAASRQQGLFSCCSRLREIPACTRALMIVLVIVTISPGGRLSAQNDASKAVAAPSVISFLNQSIEWYRHLSVEQQLATEPGDALFLNDDRQLADQVIRLSFDFAQAEASLQSREGAGSNESPDQTASSEQSRYHSLLEIAAKADQQVKQSQKELE